MSDLVETIKARVAARKLKKVTAERRCLYHCPRCESTEIGIFAGFCVCEKCWHVWTPEPDDQAAAKLNVSAVYARRRAQSRAGKRAR